MRKLQFWYIENGTFFSIAIAKHFRDNPMHNKNLTYGETIQQNNWVKTHCIAEIVDSNISYENAENKMNRGAHNDYEIHNATSCSPYLFQCHNPISEV